MKGLGNLMKQAQEMQANLEKAQKELAEMEVTGESGGGMVKVTMTGRHDVRRVSIAPELMDDRDMLEDMTHPGAVILAQAPHETAGFAVGTTVLMQGRQPLE